MFFLPKGMPLVENRDISRQRLPDILAKMGAAGFTGYAGLHFPASGAILLMEGGGLTQARLERDGGSLTGLEALAALSGLMLRHPGTMDAYRLSDGLARCVRELLRGEPLQLGRELRLLDLRALLDKIRDDRISGCLRTYVDDGSSLIFYRDGRPLGFFHDGCFELENSAGESRRIAALPGARIDLIANRRADGMTDMNLLEVIDIPRLWEWAAGRYQA